MASPSPALPLPISHPLPTTRSQSKRPPPPPSSTQRSPAGGSPMSFGPMSFGMGMSYQPPNMASGGGGKSWKPSGMGFGSYANRDSFMDTSDYPLNPMSTPPMQPHNFPGGSMNNSYRGPGGIMIGSSGRGMGMGGGMSYGAGGGLGMGGMSYGGGGGMGMGMSIDNPMGSVGQGGSWRAKMMRREAEFCKDYICCGRDLGSMHELLEHYEDHHVHPLPSPSLSTMSLSAPSPSPSAPALPDNHSEIDVDMDVDEDEDSGSSGGGGGTSTETSPVVVHAVPGLLAAPGLGLGGMGGGGVGEKLKALALEDVIKGESAFEDAFISPPSSNPSSSSSLSPPKTPALPGATPTGISGKGLNLSRKHYPGGRYGGPTPNHASSAWAIKSAFFPTVRKDGGGDVGAGVVPGLLFLSKDGGEVGGAGGKEEEGEQGGGGKEDPGAAASASAGPSVPPVAAEGDKDPQPSLFATHRPFRCPQPGCQKSYKQSNGLKYHMSKGQCNFEVRDAVEWGGLTQEEAEIKSRPFMCAAGEGCGKRYRQMNGLKYHYMNSGPHGEIGLLLLAQGSHPQPPSIPPTPTTKPRVSSNTIVASSRGTATSSSTTANAFRTGGWVKDAQKATKGMGLPVSGNEVRGAKGEEAVLFSTEDERPF